MYLLKVCYERQPYPRCNYTVKTMFQQAVVVQRIMKSNVGSMIKNDVNKTR